MRVAWTILAALGALFGAAGVALAALGAHHGGNPLVTIAAYFLLFHAAAITSFCAGARLEDGRPLLAAAACVALGVFLFSGELALHGLTGATPLPVAAPIGGLLMIVGWLVAAVALPLELHRRFASGS